MFSAKAIIPAYIIWLIKKLSNYWPPQIYPIAALISPLMKSGNRRGHAAAGGRKHQAKLPGTDRCRRLSYRQCFPPTSTWDGHRRGHRRPWPGAGQALRPVPDLTCWLSIAATSFDKVAMPPFYFFTRSDCLWQLLLHGLQCGWLMHLIERFFHKRWLFFYRRNWLLYKKLYSCTLACSWTCITRDDLDKSPFNQESAPYSKTR
jgi:hypothetical protein